MKIRFLFLLCLIMQSVSAAPIAQVDMATVNTDIDVLQRVYGSVGDGSFGVPVAGGFDIDGDGHNDYAMAAMTASPFGRAGAGTIFLVFGDGTIGGEVDTDGPNTRVLPIHGAAAGEHAGSEIWMARITNTELTPPGMDPVPLGDLIICRQDYTKPGQSEDRVAVGAVTIIPGQEILRTMAENNNVIDLADASLAAANNNLNITTLIGASEGEFPLLANDQKNPENEGDRLCMWARNGDVSGDGIDDLAVGADQEDRPQDGPEPVLKDSGAVYVIRGGPHLSGAGELDLADFGTASTPLPNNLLRVRLPRNPFASYSVNGNNLTSPITKNNVSQNSSENFHFGSTLTIAELDGDSNAELLVVSGLARAGGSLSPSGDGSGGSHDGTVFIVWGDNFSEPWATAADFELDNLAGSLSIIDGADGNVAFGEELLGGLDYNNDGAADVYIGDLVANGIPDLNVVARGNAGSGHIIYTASQLKNQLFDWQSPIVGLQYSNFLGPIAGAIDGDTAMHGDFNADGIDDLAVSAPHDRPLGRSDAGTLHVLLGKDGANWPTTMDFNLSSFPSSANIQVINYLGAKGTVGGNRGDTLSYSGASGDLDKDGFIDIITNEMVGDGSGGLPEDVGNLIIISGKGLAAEIPEPPGPPTPCEIFIVIPALSGNTFTVCL